MNMCRTLDLYVKYFLRFAILELKMTVKFHSWIVTSFVIALVLLNVHSLTLAYFKQCESFKMTYHISDCTQKKNSRSLKIFCNL
jgi:hypothetical protein